MTAKLYPFIGAATKDEGEQLASALHVLECYNEQYDKEPVTRFSGPEVKVYIVRDQSLKAEIDQLIESRNVLWKGEAVPRI